MNFPLWAFALRCSSANAYEAEWRAYGAGGDYAIPVRVLNRLGVVRYVPEGLWRAGAIVPDDRRSVSRAERRRALLDDAEAAATRRRAISPP